MTSSRKENRLLVTTRYVYVLALENNCFYVGTASNLKRRLIEHFTKKPRIKWIVKNPIICVAHTETLVGDLYQNYDLEDKIALGLANTLGVDYVRGGKLSGHPEKAPDSWLTIVKANTPVDIEKYNNWSDSKLLKYLKYSDNKDE